MAAKVYKFESLELVAKMTAQSPFHVYGCQVRTTPIPNPIDFCVSFCVAILDTSSQLGPLLTSCVCMLKIAAM
jgi:hypothetical protein